MSRNIDKANTVLYRLQEQKAEAAGYIDYNSTARPRFVQKATTLKDAENWRQQVLKEISEKLFKIQDERLSDYQIRDLNDELNKLMREKLAWEYHIKELGGVNYIQSKNKNIFGGFIIRGYTYFGRAKELKGVKELIQKKSQNKEDRLNELNNNKTKLQKLKELEERVNLKYFGYEDEEFKLVDDDEFLNDEKIWVEAKDILGDLITHKTENSIEPKTLNDKLLKFERRATKKRIKQMRKEIETLDHNDNDNDIELPNEPIPLDKVQKYLVDRRRKELEKKYNI